MAMKKPLPYGCIKKQDKVLTLTEFNKILDSLFLDNNIGDLFTVDIKFHNVNEKTLFFNELYPPIFEKTRKLTLLKGLRYNLLVSLSENEEKNTLNSFPCNSKTHSTLKEKKFILLYAKDLCYAPLCNTCPTPLCNFFAPLCNYFASLCNQKKLPHFVSHFVILCPYNTWQVSYRSNSLKTKLQKIMIRK